MLTLEPRPRNKNKKNLRPLSGRKRRGLHTHSAFHAVCQNHSDFLPKLLRYRNSVLGPKMPEKSESLVES